jgi:hypothetical protein
MQIDLSTIHPRSERGQKHNGNRYFGGHSDGWICLRELKSVIVKRPIRRSQQPTGYPQEAR